VSRRATVYGREEGGFNRLGFVGWVGIGLTGAKWAAVYWAD
jgi:hypothetical protein